MKILLKLMYDGSEYAGFQVQPNADTVQKRLNEACEKVFSRPCDVCGCSRTDSGVHALAFVCSVSPAGMSGFSEGEISIPAGRVHRALNRYLPSDIAVIGAAFVPDSFHPRYGALGKEYVYRILDGTVENPFLYGRVWRIPYNFSDDMIRTMSELASCFAGKHDFRAFMSAGSSVSSTERTVSLASVVRRSDSLIEFTVKADGFLYNMVRIMTGTLTDAAAGRLNEVDIRRAFESGERSCLGVTAPPHGLYLKRVEYAEEPDWKAD